MKILTNRNLIQKVIIAFVCITLIEFCITPHVVRAKDPVAWGGTLFENMKNFVVAVADTAISVVQLGLTGKWSFAVDKKGSGLPLRDGEKGEYWVKENVFKYPIIQISPELIFANQIRLLDANFIRGESKDSYIVETNNTEGIEDLRKVIASWYVTLRTIAIVGLLSVLIYIGIRIIISSSMQDRAKYKQRLVDWIAAFCLLFFMHYIMAGVLDIVDKVNDTLSVACGLNTEADKQGIELNPKYGGVKYTGNINGNPVGGTSSTSSTQGGVNSADEGFATDEEAIQSIIAKVGMGEETPVEQSENWESIGEPTVTHPDSHSTVTETKYMYTIKFEEKTITIYKIVNSGGWSGQGQEGKFDHTSYTYDVRYNNTNVMQTYNRTNCFIRSIKSILLYQLC